MGAARKLVPRDVYADLFCGGGGFSKGLALACEELGVRDLRLIAVNHAQIAVDTHKANHPWAEHYCSRVDQLDVRKLVPGGRVKLLLASPECTNHANARGGRPINDQSRATAWDIVKWAQELYVETILVENVREIMDWGPLGADGRPLKSKKGEIFAAWLEAIRRCGYRLDHRILNSADYGAATTRRRFFLVARRANRAIAWPEATHSKDADKCGDLFRGVKPWRGAWEIVDWSKKGVDLFRRREFRLKALSNNTIARIEAGARKFWGAIAEPFIITLRGTSKEQVAASAHSIQRPLPTVTGGGIHAGIVEPFVITPGGTDVGVGRTVKSPLPVVMTRERFALIEPFVLQQQSGGAPRSVKKPLPSIAGAGAQAIIEPFIVGAGGPERGGRPQRVNKPLGTVLGRNHRAIIEPFIVPNFGERQGQKPRTHDMSKPLPAVTSHGAGAIVEPFVVHVAHGSSGGRGNKGRARSVRQPLGTVTRENGHALVAPFIVKYYGSGSGAVGVELPLPTVTGKDRFGVVTPFAVQLADGDELRARFRMFEDYELARAMGFEGYEFKGTKKQRILMIGNAVEVHQAKALCKAILEVR